jgi:transposase
MAGSRHGQAISTQLGLGLFEQFALPHLSIGSRGPALKLSLFKIFNYILQQLYLGCQWKELPIDKMAKVVRRSTTPASIALGGAGRPMAAWMPFLRAR